MRTVMLACALAATVARGAEDPCRHVMDEVTVPDPVSHILRQALPKRDGWVDYAALARRRDVLENAIALLACEDTTGRGWSALARAGLQVDLYNLVMLRAVIDRWRPGWTPAADGFAVFKAPLVPALDGPISLDELEKRRTRALVDDPRLHVAFNCAASSCPRLVSRPWGERIDIDGDLEVMMRAFVRDTTRNRVDHTRRVLRLSRIFDWYQADFGGRAGVLRTVSKHLGRDVSGYRVEFLEYDWSLNALTFPDGSKPR